MSKIRFVNPVRECLHIQGKAYTAVLIGVIVFAMALAVVSAILNLPIHAAVSGIMGIGSTIYFGWWFGIEILPEKEETN